MRRVNECAPETDGVGFGPSSNHLANSPSLAPIHQRSFTKEASPKKLESAPGDSNLKSNSLWGGPFICENCIGFIGVYIK